MMSSKKLLKYTVYSLFLIIMTFVIFLIIEGASSVIILSTGVLTPQKLPESFHVEHDDLLGWTNKPNLYVKDSYSPGIYFQTNSQSFRNNKDFSVKVPEAKIRIICLGDSNTLGVGVSNDDTWCQLLSSIDSRLETVNMGQGGYGIDQAYLWYKRDGLKLDHQINIFAFIEDDFRRAKYDTFWGYHKPYFTIENDTLVLKNVPVPESASTIPIMTMAADMAKELRAYKLLKKLKRKSGIEVKSLSYRSYYDEHIQELSLKILESLQETSNKAGSALITMYLPTMSDYDDSSPWRKFLSVELDKRGIIFIDMTEEVKTQSKDLMFDGHYSVYGNKFLAQTLYDKLLSIPEIKNKFNNIY